MSENITRRPRPIITRTPRPKIERIPKPIGYVKARVQPIVKSTPSKRKLHKILSTVSGFVENLTTDMEGTPSSFYDYQKDHMENDWSFRNVDKSRQVGFSYTFAAESLSKTHLKNLQTSIFISYNQEEANEKIRFARALYESIPTKYQKRLVTDNKQSLEFEHKGRKTRIISFAQRQPRGKGNNTDVYLDEMAHMMWGQQIYVASLPVISRGTGVLTTASTPLGKGNLHYEISTNEERYPMFSRMKVYWWDCPELCNNVKKARKKAPYMRTEERIRKFGTIKLNGLFDAMDLEDFMQEYELYYADTTLSYYPVDLINTCVFDFDDEKLESNIDPEEAPVGWKKDEESESSTIMDKYSDRDIYWFFKKMRIQGTYDDPVTMAGNLIDEFVSVMNTKKFGRELLVGVDIGRKRDTSEISIFEQIDYGNFNLHIERLSIEMDNAKFKAQRKVLKMILDALPVKKMRIDATGIGTDIAENLEDEYPGIVEGINFGMENKAEMAKNFKYRLEDKTIAIFNDVESIKQIHSIKKTVTESSNVKYGTEKNVKGHHGDKFWAKALASSAGDGYDRNQIVGKFLVQGEPRIFVPKKQEIITAIPISSGKPRIGVFATDRGGVRYADPMQSMFTDNYIREVY